MDRQQQITNLYNNATFHSKCYSMAKGRKDDLVSHVVLLLLELPDADFNKIECLNTYAYGIAFKRCYDKYSPFNKEFGVMESEELKGDYGLKDDSDIELAVQQNIEDDYQVTINVIKKDLTKQIASDKFPVEHHVWEIYLKNKTIRATADHFNIPTTTTYRIIKSFKDKIKANVNRSTI